MNTQRTNYHRKNPSNTNVVTARTRKSSHSKDKPSQSKQSQSKEKNKQIKIKLQRRMSFQSPKKAFVQNYKNFSLLNYMIMRQKNPNIQKITIPAISGAITQRQRQKQVLNKSLFKYIQVLGKGGFGRVMKVEYLKNHRVYAMKQMSKTVIITKKSIQSVINERQLLSQLKHPFLVNMIYAFQDRSNLYLVMDYMPGGDLRYQIGKFQKFQQNVVKFFVCCILLGLQYLHNNNIIHRDIKPQNIILDKQGYLRITDMGIARMHTNGQDNYKDTSGTPGYMSPEVINRENHSFQVDFFALGVIAYQCMMGKRPYRGYSRQQIRQQILLYEASIKKHQIPDNWSKESADCINKLLKRRPHQRIGCNGVKQIMSHPWFNDIDWQKMLTKKYSSPFMPNLNDRNYDTVSQSEYDDETLYKMNENQLLLRKKSVQDLFNGYQYEQTRYV